MNALHEPPAVRRWSAACRWMAFILLAGYLLFAHGCHGDEDHELLARVVALLHAW
jgi:hypothetical protein